MSRPLSNYPIILKGLKEKIRQARLRASLKVNTELLAVYWEIGHAILVQQKEEGWGTKVIDRLAADLKTEFPDMQGLSVRNIKYMRAFAETWPLFGQQVAAQLQYDQNEVTATAQKIPSQPAIDRDNSIVQQLAAQLPWGHHQVILDKVKKQEERLFYIAKCAENGWSRNVLSEQIASGLIERQGKTLNNFKQTLPAHDSDLAVETFKSPYVFDFLTLSEDVREKDLERALVQHLKKFMLELGKGFAYVGNQYNLEVGGDEFFLDLLFYNFHLHCFVIFELKIGEFNPEFAGKLNFYINAVNEKIKGGDDKPTIGVLLCKTPNETIIKYSLSGIDQPMGIADYKLAKALPKKLKGEIPSIEELEKELKEETERFKKPVDQKMKRLKDLIKHFKEPKVKEERTPVTSKRIFTKVVLLLRDQLKQALLETSAQFKKTEYILWMDDQGFHSDKEAKAHFEKHKGFNQFRIEVIMDGFLAAGTKAFQVHEELFITTNRFNYSIGLERYAHNGAILPEKLYHELPSKKETELVMEKFHEKILDAIIQHIERIQGEKSKPAGN